MAHRLQTLFATADGEANYVGALRALIEDGQLHAAETVLMADIAALDTTLAQICADTPRETVILNGWPELVEAIASYEGDPVTGVTIGMGNEPDLAFEKDRLHAPFVTLGLYCDGDFAFSSASRAELLAECQAETPRWAGAEEDVEVYLEIDGLADINTRLIHHKHRFFLRDGAPDQAPALFVEAVLCGWFRALRFHQAVRAAIDSEGLPGSIPVMSGMFGMTPEVTTVHIPEKTVKTSIAEVAPLVMKPKARREDAIVDLSGADLRRRVVAAAGVAEDKPGFFARLFRRSA